MPPAPILTERVLARLPGPTGPWMVVWSASYLIFLATAQFGLKGNLPDFSGSMQFGVLNFYLSLVAFVGIRRLGRDIATLKPKVAELRSPEVRADRTFAAVGNSVWPLILTFVLTLAFGLPALRSSPVPAAALATLGRVVGALPFNTFMWVYIVVVFELYRLGHQPLMLRSFVEDRSLGLRPLGALAFTAFWIMVMAVAPFAIFALFKPTTPLGPVPAVLAIVMVCVIVSFFFLSLLGLRRQLLRTKGEHQARMRIIFADVLRPAWESGSAATLREQALELLSAETVERRIGAIQEWPFDERILRTVLAIGSSIVTAILVRLVTRQLGL